MKSLKNKNYGKKQNPKQIILKLISYTLKIDENIYKQLALKKF